MGVRGRNYVEQNFSRSAWALRFERRLKELFTGARTPARSSQGQSAVEEY